MTRLKRYFLLLVTFVAFGLTVKAADQFVSFANGDIKLCQQNDKLSIYVSDNDNIGVKLAAQNLCTDFNKVCGAQVSLTNSVDNARIIVGTLGQSEIIDKLAKQGVFDIKELKGKTEKYLIIPVSKFSLDILPFDKSTGEGRGEAVVIIVGSDRRGTIYGIYELSRQIGVSPWYYWADVPVKKQSAIYVNNGTYTDGEPAVRYRGIFLNDEAPCLTSWVKNTFGTKRGGHDFYAKVFELILRMKGNYMWPAMWSWAFYADDPLNGKTADDMGVMIGTSHHEPMSRSQQEWKNRGKWDYSSNKAQLDSFWLGGVERNKTTEDIITIGMRGDGDMEMSPTRNVKLLESVIENQRKLISKARGKAAKDVPQMWALYKEVQDYYDDGMRVPDDVTILLCDDNWGNVRRVPTLKERKRKGGWGLYYHVDYVGAPRNSKTINVTPIENMWEQLNLAYNNGIQKLWILNVGDLKPMEYPIQLFMDMAWKGELGVSAFADGQNAEELGVLNAHTTDFCKTIVGDDKASEAARILEQCCKLNGRCTPEMLDANTYNLETGEWAKVIDEYKTLEIEALRQYAELPQESRDAYYEIILFPIQFMCNLHQMYYAQAMNNALYKKGDAKMNYWADKCEEYFKRDAELCNIYNKVLANGKWDGMMTQKHIGYTSWNDNFKADIMPKVYRADYIQNIFDEDGKGYVAIEAEHYYSSECRAESVESGKSVKWTTIPNFGRTHSGVTLMPVTNDVTGASLTYKFKVSSKLLTSNSSLLTKIHIVTKSTLDYLNKGGMTYNVSLDGGEAKTINFNSDMNENPENIYSKYYPTVARRVIEKTVELPLGTADSDGIHTLTFSPNDPGIILEKIVIDFGGYKQQYLFGEESLRK